MLRTKLAFALIALTFAASAQQTTDTLLLRETLQHVSIGAEDGFVTETAAGTGSPGKSETRDSTLMVGDDRENRRRAGFLSFDIPALPEGTTIRSARLRLARKVVSGNPSALGAIQIHIMTADGIAVPELTEVSTATTIDPNNTVQVYTLPKETEGVGTVEILPGLFDLLRGGKVGVRIAMAESTNGNKIADYVSLYSGDAAPGMRPTIEVETERTIPTPTQPALAGAPGEATQITLWSNADEDGELSESSKGSGSGGGVNRATPTMLIGDTSRGAQSKVLLSFDTSVVPVGAVVESATLYVYVTKTYGNPGALGALTVDGRLSGLSADSWRFGTETTADPTDFRAKGHALGLPIVKSFSGDADFSIALTPLALAGINRGGPTQYILQFEKPSNNDAKSDGILVGSGNSGADNRATPRLVLSYRVAATP